MNFLAPAAFAFAATLPVVVLFYLLKRKRVIRLVSSTILWQKFITDTQASAPFQKLRHNWLLLLQLLLLALAIFALARPYFAGKTQGGRFLVAILDASASMQSVDQSPSRFEAARREALQLVNSLQDTDQMVVLLAAGHTEVKQSPTSNKTELRRALEGCRPTDSPTRLAEALKLAQPLVRDQPFGEIHLFSDGATVELKEFENQGLNVVYRQFGQRADNLGVVHLDVRSHPDDPTQRALFTSIANASSNIVQTEVELLLDGQLLESRPLDLEARATVPLVFTATQARDGVFTVRLTAQDDLAADNQASVFSALPQPVQVLLVTRGNNLLRRALTVVPHVRLSEAADLTDDARGFDFVVLDDVLPTAWPAVNTLAIRTARTNWFDLVGSVENPPIVDWRASHPLLRFVSFDTVGINQALAIRPPTWALPLVDSQQTPLIVAGEFERRRVLWLGFNVLDSNWPLRVTFPIFVANAIDWLNPAAANAGQFLIRAGDPIRFAPATLPAEGRMTLPDRSVQPVPLPPGAREFVFANTQTQGVYRFEAGTNQTAFCVNLLDAAETDTTPRKELNLGAYSQVAATVAKPANLELWRWIAAAGLLVLLGEWWYYHRRTA